MEEKLERITTFSPAFDKRHDDPKKNYGIHSMECRMVVKGKKGAIQFLFYTGILLPETVKEYFETGRAKYEVHSWGVTYLNKPMAASVGYHSPKSMYKGQSKMEKCDYIKGGCYYDSSALRADEWFDILIRKGSGKIWEMLEEEYKSVYL